MKECPQCHEQFDDREAFCDQDGSTLIDQTDSIREALTQRPQSSSVWITGVIGGFIGVMVCVLLYALFLAPNPRELDQKDGRASAQESTASRATQLAAAPAPQTNPIAVASPSPEAEAPSPSPSPTQAPAAPVTTPALNNGPIATGTKEAREAEHAIIKMKDGSTVDADAAWEDAQGIWYRRSGLVSFVEKSRVEAIIEQPQRQPAKAEVKTP